jgi:hypothetical protein
MAEGQDKGRIHVEVEAPHLVKVLFQLVPYISLTSYTTSSKALTFMADGE